MTRNKLIDLNNHLFEQLENLSDPDITGERLKEEMERSKAIVHVASSIVGIGRLALEGQMFIHESGRDEAKLPAMLDE